MFDIGFSELMVIAVVALIVIGPERLPRVARTLGHLAGRLQRYVADVKADINREVELDELRKMRDSMQQAASSFAEHGATSELCKASSEVASVEGELNAAAAEPRRSRREQPRSNRAKPVLRERAGKLHLPPGRAAHAAAARAGRDRAWSSSRCCFWPGAGPYLRLPRRAADGSALPQGSKMIATGVITPFMVPMKVTALAALMVALPYVLYQAVGVRRARALRAREEARSCRSIVASTLLFFCGVAFCYYFVFGQVFAFIADFAPKSITPAPDIEAYFTFVHDHVPRLRRHVRDPDRGDPAGALRPGDGRAAGRGALLRDPRQRSWSPR